MNGWEEIGKAAVVVPCMTILSFALGAWRALVVSILWGWFFVPAGMPQLPFGVAFGAIILWAAFRSSSVDTKDVKKQKDTDYHVSNVFLNIISPAISLGFGYLVKLIVL